jgi:hypothetical protein
MLAHVEREVSRRSGDPWRPEQAAVAARKLYPQELILVPDNIGALHRAIVARSRIRRAALAAKPGLANPFFELVGLAAQPPRVREQGYEIVEEELLDGDRPLTSEQWRIMEILGTAEDCVRNSAAVAVALATQIGSPVARDIRLAAGTGGRATEISGAGVWVGARLDGRGNALATLLVIVARSGERGAPRVENSYALVPELALELLRLPHRTRRRSRGDGDL